MKSEKWALELSDGVKTWLCLSPKTGDIATFPTAEQATAYLSHWFDVQRRPVRVLVTVETICEHKHRGM